MTGTSTARKYASLAAMLAAVFALDWFTSEVSVAPFYILTVAYARWQLGLGTGIGAAVACSLLWAVADYGSGHRFSHPWVLAENVGVRLFTYALTVAAISLYRRTLEAHRRRLAMLERLLSVCPGCGAIAVNEIGWRKPSQFHEDSVQVYTLCPTCAAAHPPNVAQDTSRLPPL
jgi:hypothetical protein